MPGTRSSARLQGSPPPSQGLDEAPKTGTKRKASVSSQTSPAHKSQKKELLEDGQTTLDDSLETAPAETKGEDVEMKEAPKEATPSKTEGKDNAEEDSKNTEQDETVELNESEEKTSNNDQTPLQSNGAHKEKGTGNATDKQDEAPKEVEKASGSNGAQKESANGNALDAKETQNPEEPQKPSEASTSSELNDGIVETSKSVDTSSQREKASPRTILEQGIIYFFTRGRVGIEDPESVSDLQRTYFVLRPLPKGAKLKDGPLGDSTNNRLFALPKKAFPKSHSDRYMAFVEKSNCSIKDLKEEFFSGTVNETKTQGTRVTPNVTPVGEGVYAFTHNSNTSHLVYMLTVPSQPGEFQNDLGIYEKGSFVISVKNPERKGPANATLPEGPSYPKEIIEEFRGLAWSPLKPHFINYDNVQILLIGEGTGDDLGKAVAPSKKDEKQDKDTPLEVIEKLEHEDELRVEHLNGDDSVFDDLQISKDDYPELPTTW